MTLREDIVAYALWGVVNEPQIHYSQGRRRMAALDHPRTLPLYTDCSAFVTLAYKDAGAPDPNGLEYDGFGFTGTLLVNLEHIGVDEALPGDLIVYGPGAGDHVVVLIESGASGDPLCVSHGQERGPIKVRHSIERNAHRAPVTVLRGAGLDDAPTPPPEEEDVPKQALFFVAKPHPDHEQFVLGAHGYHEAVRVLDPAHLGYLQSIFGAPQELPPLLWDQLVIVEPSGHKP